MIVLGIEGTAHTISAGIVDENKIISNSSSTYIPLNGGIHPREAAIHHADHVLEVMHNAFKESGLTPEDIDLVSFSKGPGLGPCLRIAATASRAFSLRYKIPIIGVNHPLGHVEIGRKLSGAVDPIMLYISGGNTQIIAHEYGKYRVLGETMDIGLGNMLDKFARDANIPFPGGPEIEKMALSGKKLLKLPYSVKGMDTSFSGMYTAAKNFLNQGEKIENISYSIQEYSFSMVIEVLERALYYTNKNEILLAGGVAKNDRLRSMVLSMAEESGYRAYLTDKKYCMDNGAMIAQAGMLLYENGEHDSIMDTKVNQKYRIDEVNIPWINSDKHELTKNRGAESRIRTSRFFGRKVIIKDRLRKSYRDKNLDIFLRKERTRNEFFILYELRNLGISVPLVYDYDRYKNTLILEYIDGITLNELILKNGNIEHNLDIIAKTVAKMHKHRISHGDLTPNNFIIGDRLYILDPSMGKIKCEDEDIADDVFLMSDSLNNLYGNYNLSRMFLSKYSEYNDDHKHIFEIVREIKARRRYV